MPEHRVSPSDLRHLATRALRAANTRPETAACVADALVLAELDGIPSHGVSRVPYYAAHLRHGRVDGWAVPEVSRTAPAAIRVDARHGFAYPAVAAGIAAAERAVAEAGVVSVAIGQSHHCGVLGHHVEALAEAGLAALMFANAGSVMAAPGGGRPMFGTNPIAFACPGANGLPLVVDLSMSVAARGKLVLAAERGQAIPEGWALDRNGRPTTDPAAALGGGTLAAIGGAKGAALAMAVDILAGALTGSAFSSELSSHFETGPGLPFANGQLIIAFAPARIGAERFTERVEELCSEVLAEPGIRLPGQRRAENRLRLAAEGISVRSELLAELSALGEPVDA